MAKCNFCPNSNSGYSCPRCNAAYCSLACYRRPEHEGCYEQFYKECVADEMRLRSKEDAEDPAVKRRMIETLKRMRQQGGDFSIEIEKLILYTVVHPLVCHFLLCFSV